jgi:HEAT repeat protein
MVAVITFDIHELVEQLSSTSAKSQLAALQSLAHSGSLVVPILLHELSVRSSYRDKVAIITALEKIGDSQSVEMLLELLTHPSTVIRMSVAKALGNFPEAKVCSALIERLNQETGVVQSWIIVSLGKLHDQHAVEPLLNLLTQTSSASTKQDIIRALGELGDKRAIPQVRAFTNDPVAYVQITAHRVLQQLSQGDKPSNQSSSFFMGNDPTTVKS